MPGGVWGEGNTRDFLAWADFCQKKALENRGLHITANINFSNISHPAAIAAKEQLLNLIESRRRISVQDIYNTISPDLAANPTTKTLLMQLYYENNLRIEGSQQNAASRESNFVLIFENRQRKEKQFIQKPKKTIEKHQSNIEDLLDNSWRATGRKLQFNQKAPPPPSEINNSLKKEVPKNPRVVSEKPVEDVRAYLNKETLRKGMAAPPKVERPQVPKFEVPPIPAPPSPKLPEIQVELPTIEVAPVITPLQPIRIETPKVEKFNDLEFAGLESFELYLLEAFFLDAAVNTKQKDNKAYFKTNAHLCKTKGDIRLMENGETRNGFIKGLLWFFSFTIVLLPVAISYSKNKKRHDAKKEYIRLRKKITFEQMQKNMRNKYPNVIK